MPQQPSSADLAKQFGGSPVADLAAQFGGVPVADMPAPMPSHQPTASERFGASFGEQVNPVSIVKSTVNAIAHPIDTVQGILANQQVPYDKMKASFNEGDYGTAARHALGYAIPVLGPMLDEQSDKAQQGNVAGAVGGTLGMGLVNFGLPVAAKGAATAYPAVKAALKAKIAPAESGRLMSDLTKAMPPSSVAAYNPMDVQRAMPYLKHEHGQAPITTIESFRDAADSAITQIEEHIGQYIAAHPADRIGTQPLQAARNALARGVRQSDMAGGMAELADLGLDKPLTLAEADAIRLRLNAENQAILKKNNYDVATASKVDPGFTARRAAVNALRDGIYEQLEARGIEGVRRLRQDEGALITLRNAAQRQIFSGDKTVGGTGKNTIPAKVFRAAVPAVSSAAGAYIGGAPGAAGGAVTGMEIARRMAPPNLTRDALIERAFAAVKAGDAPKFPVMPAERGPMALLPSHPTELPRSSAPDTSFVRGVPAHAQGPRPDRALPAPAGRPMPPAPDRSGVRVIEARGVIVRDPKTGRFKRVYTTEEAP